MVYPLLLNFRVQSRTYVRIRYILSHRYAGNMEIYPRLAIILLVRATLNIYAVLHLPYEVVCP